ncbi:hypothetical protein DPMN_016644 [Dreissena polymorpha]|uniref:C2H2-type domain-containing protein n=1 Tax=Dreissena polymorpha TaxID=45954 RepID=A0A9D4NDW4_DREPO|nr:hypothetical protein DPMN_016644 [Dreissena polymorpha]
MNKGTKKRYECKSCNKSYTTNSRLNFHVKNVHQTAIRRTMCLVCNRRFSSLYNLKVHQRYVHAGIQKRQACKECVKRFSSKRDLADHCRQYHGAEKLTCELCHAEFGYIRNLKRHAQHCGADKKKTHTCDVCQKMYRSKRALNVHTRVKHLGSICICQICGKNFERKYSLSRHLKNMHKN